jgi:serine/threonine protein kinase
LKCFSKWKTAEKEWLSFHQWRVIVPYFKLDSDGRAENYNFPDQTILPWLPWEEGDSVDTNSEPAKDEGGYAEVAKIRIDPSSHGFQKVLQSVSLFFLIRPTKTCTIVSNYVQICLNDDRFALKVLHDGAMNTETQYLNEVEQLKRFSGLVHDHLVTVLATFTLKNRFHFLFPYAEYALDQYWRDKVPQPSLDLATVQWFSKQCLGLIEAMHTIHEPDHLNDLAGVKKYGRHGDIKPDNILWFNTTRDPKGIFVISDMGLSAFNSAKSRSNVPGHALPGAPGYRPPECELEGGTVSRQFDVWTMGCLLLELVTWLLGGQQMLDEFQSKRMSVYINGSKNDIFFEIKRSRGKVPVVAQVKHTVTEVGSL